MDDKILEANRKINLILRDLEIETQSIVEDLSLVNIDVTSMMDDHEQFRRTVNLRLRRLPGTKWEV